MNTAIIIEHLDTEISRLQQAKAILTGMDVRKGSGRPKATDEVSRPVVVEPTKRVMSAEGKQKIAAAQKSRWAKVRKAAKKAAKVADVRPVEKALQPTLAKSVKKAVKGTKAVKSVMDSKS